MGAVYEREVKSYFNTMTGYLVCAFLLMFAGVYTMAYNLNYGYPNFEYVLQGMSFIFMIVVPILTMRSVAEERRQKTDQLLYALPIPMTRIVLGKFFAMVTVFLLPTALIALYPLLLSSFGTVSFITAYGALAGFIFMGAAFIAVGLFISSLTENQAIAAVLCFLALLVNYFLTSTTEFVSESSTASFVAVTVIIVLIALLLRVMTKNTFVSVVTFLALEVANVVVLAFSPDTLSGLLTTAMEKLSLFDRFDTFVGGVFDITSLVFYLVTAGVFLFFTVQSLEKRRWS
jgi:ABC-2 type transport system permease protein